MKIFISHASEDKSILAKPLAESLKAKGYDVWYDEYSLKLGDSLSREIDRGLAICDYGIVILSKAFFEKQWPQKELSGLIARETNEIPPKKLILPIWHEVDADQIRKYSPTLADKVAVSTSTGLNHVIDEILRALGEDSNSKTQFEKIIRYYRNPRELVNEIIPSSPENPIWGFSPDGINIIMEFIAELEEYGKVTLLADIFELPYEKLKILFHKDKYVFLVPNHGMGHVYLMVLDLAFCGIGRIRTRYGKDEDSYQKALDFFIGHMGFGKDNRCLCEVMPVINAPNEISVSFPVIDGINIIS